MNHKNDLGSWHTVITHEIAHEFDLKELAMSLTMEKYLQELPTSLNHKNYPWFWLTRTTHQTHVV